MRLVEEAVESIPEQFRERLANVDFVIEETPQGDEVESGELLLGLYQGVPLTERDSWWDAGSLPDRITIFREPILDICASREDVIHEVAVTVVHEVAHHFGIYDDRLHELGWG